MPTTAASAQGIQLSEPLQFGRAVKQWLKQNSAAALQSAILGGLFGYGLNFAMSFFLFNGRFDGSQGVLGSLVKSSLFFGILSTVAFGLIGYRRAVGKERFWQAIRDTPKNVAVLFSGTALPRGYTCCGERLRPGCFARREATHA